MTTDERFNQIYQTIVDENAADMEVARGEAKVEDRHNKIFLTFIIIINIALNYGWYKLFNEIPEEFSALLFVISFFVYSKKKRRGGKSKIAKYTMDFKTRIVGTMIKSFEGQLEFMPQSRSIFKRFL